MGFYHADIGAPVVCLGWGDARVSFHFPPVFVDGMLQMGDIADGYGRQWAARVVLRVSFVFWIVRVPASHCTRQVEWYSVMFFLRRSGGECNHSLIIMRGHTSFLIQILLFVISGTMERGPRKQRNGG